MNHFRIKAENVKVLVGTQNLKRNGTLYKAQELFHHSRYDKSYFILYDIANCMYIVEITNTLI